MINVLCGLTHHSSGEIFINNLNLAVNRKKVKSMIGLVPQELHLEAFETVLDNVKYSRGLWGKKEDEKYILNLLKKLNLIDKKSLLIGRNEKKSFNSKALSHQPIILFLDEPSAGVDIELRKEMGSNLFLKKRE